MLATQIYRKVLPFLMCFLSIAAQTSCTPKANHFGIIFSNNSGDIYRIPDSTQSKIDQLTFTPTIDEYPILVSKSGDRIIFTTNFYSDPEMKQSELATEELRHVYLLDTASKKIVDLTAILEDKYAQLGPEFYIDWLPDQEQFVRVTDNVKNSEIKSFLEIMNFDGSNRKDVPIPTIGEIPSLINSVKWSPNGRKFILTQRVIGIKQQFENPGVTILIYDLNSGDINQITDYKDGCIPREWSPNSRQIVATCTYVPPYSEAIIGPETVRIFDVENPRQPYEYIGFSPCHEPSWSPNGKQIVFECNIEKDRNGLFIANSDGNGIQEVKLGDLGNPATLRNPVWSPDGTQIIYVAGNDREHTNIYSINLDGPNNHPLTNQDGVYFIVSAYPLP